MSASRKLDVRDAVVLAFGFACIAAYCVAVSGHRILWSDEVLSWNLLTDPSWRHMLSAWRIGADGGGLGFYIFGRAWLAIFGQATLTYRAFSAVGCFVAFAATWRILRRFYPPAIGFIVLLLVWFGSRTILWQLIQTRFYGMLLGAVALSLLFAVKSSEQVGTKMHAQLGTIFLVFGCNLLLVETHPFGLLYSGMIAAGALVADRFRVGRRPWFYLAVASSWPFLLFSRTAMLNSAKINKPWSWTVPPDRYALVQQFSPHSLPHIFFVYAVAGGLALCVPAMRRQLLKGWSQRRYAVIPGVGLATVPLVFYALSRTGTSYFVDRYMIGSSIGVAIITAELMSIFFLTFDRPGLVRFVMALLPLVWLFKVGVDATLHYPQETVIPSADFTQALERKLPRDTPIVVERPDEFMILAHYNQDPRLEVRYLLDWPFVLAPHSPHGLASGYHELEDWKTAGYYSDSIERVDDFLRTTDRFVVAEGRSRWFQHRILEDSTWSVTKLDEYRDVPSDMWTTSIWIVQRRSAPFATK